MDNKIEFLLDWARRHEAKFELDGEVGFGRPCVGMTVGSSYIDLGPQVNLYADRPDEEPSWYTKDDDPDVFPEGGIEDAYHKHPCLAVLVHGDDRDKAIDQLAAWCKHLDEKGYKVVKEPRKNQGVFDVLLNGTQHVYLAKEA